MKHNDPDQWACFAV